MKLNTDKNPQPDLYMAEGTLDTPTHDGPIVEMIDRTRISEEELKAIRSTLGPGQSACEMCGTIFTRLDQVCPNCANDG